MNIFRKLVRSFRVWAFGQRPVWFGHKVSLCWSDYSCYCLEPMTVSWPISVGLPGPIARNTIRNLKNIGVGGHRMRTEVSEFLIEHNGVVETVKKFHAQEYGEGRSYHIFHICFLDLEDLVAFKLAFM